MVRRLPSCYEPAMSNLPDSGWLRALDDLKTSTVAAVSLGCWALFILAERGLLHLDALPSWATAIPVIVAVPASFLWLCRLWDLGFAPFMERRRRRAILAKLGKLSRGEAEFLDNQVRKNKQTFVDVDDLVVETLQYKGLVAPPLPSKSFLPGYTIPDFVWSELIKAVAKGNSRAHQKASPMERQ